MWIGRHSREGVRRVERLRESRLETLWNEMISRRCGVVDITEKEREASLKKLEMDEMYKRRSKYVKELTMGTRRINLPSHPLYFGVLNF
jgi:hypothetical protein